MLSIANMTSEQAAQYHAHEQNYYEQNGEIGEWQGNGAEALGLNGEIKHEVFERLCHGIHPTDEKVLVATSKRAGTDLTFSAPKSVSILMELSSKADEMAIREAHDLAVSNTIKHIEKNYTQTREQINGERQSINTNSLVVAKFQHDTSRELDPQLHTHAFILNMTQKENGEWRAIHNDELFNNKMYLGQVYRNELANNLKNLGYEIKTTDAKKGLFEIAGVSKEIMDEFSVRARQVEKRMAELKKEFPNVDEKKLIEMSKLDSRRAKEKDVNRSELRAENIARAGAILNISELLADVKNQNHLKTELTTKEILDRAKEILTDRESVFKKEDLLKETLKLSLGTHTREDFEQEMSQDAELVNFEKNLYSTKEMIEIEKSILKEVETHKDTLRSVETDEEKVKNHLAKYATLTAGQLLGAKEILKNNDLLMNVQGDAGVGKTYVLKAVNDFVKENGSHYTLQGLAYTAQAVSEIEKDSGIKSQTLHSFFNQKELPQNQIYIVDEASMVGSKMMAQLLEKAKETNSKIVLLGDTKQFQTLSAGGIFEQLQKQDFIKTVEMSESMRAKNEVMRGLYADIKAKNLENAFKTLEEKKMIQETKDLSKVKDEYIKQKKEGKDTLLIASKNSDRNALNQLIRDELKEQIKDQIKDEVVFKIKEATNLSDVEKHFSMYYKEHQSVFINKALEGFKAGSNAIIQSIDANSNILTLLSDGKLINVDLTKNGDKLSTFESVQKAFGIGEKISFTKNDKKLGIKNGETATITGINKDIISFIKGDKTSGSIDIKNYDYLDHGYAITDYKSQGQTAQNVIAVVDSVMANLNSLYVQITRAKEDVTIFTDNAELLKENSLNQQTKSSTLDFAQEEKIPVVPVVPVTPLMSVAQSLSHDDGIEM